MHISEASELNMFHNLVFTNASAHIAYSVPLQKIYLGMHMYQISLFLPNATMKYDANVTILYDFEKVSKALIIFVAFYVCVSFTF